MTATVRKLEVYQEPRPSQQPKKGKYVVNPVLLASFFVVLTVAIALGQVALHLTIVQLGYQVEEAKGLLAQAESQNQHLQVELLKVGSLEYVERVARTELGMIKPDSYEYIVLNTGRKQGDVPPQHEQPPTPTESVLASVSSWLAGWFLPGGQVEAGRMGRF
ncbi:MAG: hypothetical protein GX182_04990 [Firmicutes bacterium]|jgi:cell division protein FtsB|nr:hypothetical protein [Bacillota bacterium]